MYELIYYSTANPTLNANDISNILKTSRDFNLKNDITGCLLYYNNEFIQILEGDRMAIKKLYATLNRMKGIAMHLYYLRMK